MADREETKRMIEVMQAWVDGAEIQLRLKINNGSWMDIDAPEWSWAGTNYRVKPVPRECWRNEYTTGLVDACYDTKHEAALGSNKDTCLGQVLFREVLE